MYSVAVRLWAQVPCRVIGANQVPAPFLLPGAKQRQHDAVPDRIQLRRCGHVRADSLLSGDLRDVRGQGVVRPVLAGALLPDADVDYLVPCWVVLPQRRVGAGAVPCEQLLPARVCHGQELPCEQDLGAGVQVD